MPWSRPNVHACSKDTRRGDRHLFDRDWIQRNFLLKQELVTTGIIWEGMVLPLEPKEVMMLERLLTHGSINLSEISGVPGSKSGHVRMSRLRAKLRDLGCPLNIQTLHRNQRYILDTAAQADTGGVNERINSASPSPDSVQDLSRGTTR